MGLVHKGTRRASRTRAWRATTTAPGPPFATAENCAGSARGWLPDEPREQRVLFTGVPMPENLEKVITEYHVLSRKARAFGISGQSACHFTIKSSGWETAFSGDQGAV